MELANRAPGAPNWATIRTFPVPGFSFAGPRHDDLPVVTCTWELGLRYGQSVLHEERLSVFHDLVTSTAQQMFRVAARILGNVQDAEDVVQESYLRAYGAMATERFEGRASMRTWLYRIVTNAALDALRSRRRRRRWQVLGEADAVDEGQSIEATAALRELGSWLGELAPEQRAAIVLKELEGMTSAEVASVLGCSEGAVEQRLVRARATLRERSNRD